MNILIKRKLKVMLLKMGIPHELSIDSNRKSIILTHSFNYNKDYYELITTAFIKKGKAVSFDNELLKNDESISLNTLDDKLILRLETVLFLGKYLLEEIGLIVIKDRLRNGDYLSSNYVSLLMIHGYKLYSPRFISQTELLFKMLKPIENRFPSSGNNKYFIQPSDGDINPDNKYSNGLLYLPMDKGLATFYYIKRPDQSCGKSEYMAKLRI